MRQVFFGFPVRMEQASEGAFWVENLRAHEVDDRYFQRQGVRVWGGLGRAETVCLKRTRLSGSNGSLRERPVV